jgi:hypothetical protein
VTSRKVRAWAESLRDRPAEGGASAAAQVCREIERQHGREGLDAVLDEWVKFREAEREAWEAGRLRPH